MKTQSKIRRVSKISKTLAGLKIGKRKVEDIKAKAQEAVMTIAQSVPTVAPVAVIAAPTIPSPVAPIVHTITKIVDSQDYGAGFVIGPTGAPSKYWCQFNASPEWKGRMTWMQMSLGYKTQASMIAPVLVKLLLDWESAQGK